MTRIYQNTIPNPNRIELSPEASHHVAVVLRMKPGEPLVVFDGKGREYHSVIEKSDKKAVVVKVVSTESISRESPLKIHLGQGLCRGEKMDWIIQKSVECGVTEITPLLAEHGNVKLPKERIEKKLAHWQQVAISACEQSGRTRVPALHAPQKLEEWLETEANNKLVLDPTGDTSISNVNWNGNSCAVLIGPEGGLSANEIQLAAQHQFQGLRLGPRVLRTETAPIAVISALQARFGDWQ